MKTSKRRLGDLGEEIAVQELERLGHVILRRNWRHAHLEIDIVSRDRTGLHFVEVKSRTAPVSASPEENVTPSKQAKLATAALCFLNEEKPGDAEVFFDIITVVFCGGQTEVNYYKQAFIPTYY